MTYDYTVSGIEKDPLRVNGQGSNIVTLVAGSHVYVTSRTAGGATGYTTKTAGTCTVNFAGTADALWEIVNLSSNVTLNIAADGVGGSANVTR